MDSVKELNVNGVAHKLNAHPERTLLSVLRDDLNLTGSKYGCGEGQCGACTVLIDGKPTRSCLTSVEEAAGKPVRTIEGLANGDQLHPLQQAFLDANALQCAYCTSGMLMAASAFLEKTPNPKREEIVTAMTGHICRCGVYGRIVTAIEQAAERMKKRRAMNDSLLQSNDLFEPERYELHENLLAWELNRRDFFGLTGGLIVALLAADALAQQPPRGGGGGRGGGAGPQDIGAWLHVGEDSGITVFTGKVEVGQNIRTSLTQVVAEELRVPVERIKLIMADTQKTPTDGGTMGSRTTPSMAPQLRKVAAATRELLLDMAAEQGKLDRTLLSIKDGKIVEPQSKQSFSFGQLTKGEKLVKVVANNVATAPPDKWTVAGTSVPKMNGRDYVTGKHQYASDIHREGMLFGKVLRGPSYQATLVSVDTKAAEALPGVTVVHNGNFIGVAAPSIYEAEQALDAIKAEWKPGTNPVTSENLYKHLKEKAGAGGGRGPGGGRPARPANTLEEVQAGEQKLDASYEIAYIAHAPLEPRAAVAEWSADGNLTVWTGTQRPFGIKGDIASALGVAADKVHVIVPDTGSAYGGKHTNEAPIEAAKLAKAAGKPVKLVWTREEEFTWAYFRPAGLIEITAAAKPDGTLTAWECHNYNSGQSALPSPYDVPGQRNQFHGTDSPLKQGSYRALASTANIFARESHMDDLAHALKMDPLEFRLKNLKEPRLRAVLEAAAKQFGWGKNPAPAGRGFGIAGGTEKGSFVAACAEVETDVQAGTVKVVRIVTAFECGAILNPDQLKIQIEGATIQGLGGALYEAIQFAEGKIVNPRFSKYKVPRFKDLPLQEVVLLNRKDLPSAGAGETPIVAVAPAVGNAIFAATGIRLRSLPMLANGLKPAAKAEPV